MTITRAYKFSDRSFNQNVFTKLTSEKNVKVLMAILVLIIIAIAIDLSMVEAVVEGATFI